MPTLQQILIRLGAAVGLGTAGTLTLQAIHNQGTHIGNNCILSYCPKHEGVTSTPFPPKPVPSSTKIADGAAHLDIPKFTAIPESNGDWVVVGELADKKRPLIRTKNPNWGKEYKKDIRAKMIAGNLNRYFQKAPYPIKLSIGKSKKGYSTLCVSESINEGCLKDATNGQIMTFGSEATPQADKRSFISMLNDVGAHTQLGRVIETEGRIYIDIKRFIKGELNSVVVVGE
jgi:hypothetical protein